MRQKSGCSRLTAKSASNLLLDFDHTEIALSLIVREWNREINEIGQDLFCPREQSHLTSSLLLIVWAAPSWKMATSVLEERAERYSRGRGFQHTELSTGRAR